ncbi:toxic anion resistance protein [Xenorhabdus sp. 12]|uniref:Toxic anion resistance protein n=1 Tax=Xenorhabdus santafensis TaxID=2582833 RepID=A0ABU4S871_9GAMM|nr:toxic anion resistance protein [Xenorhabdus sp. 12]MDX7986966.1 toxic anion resistance protein [Xenorhabdus sp. 12]
MNTETMPIPSFERQSGATQLSEQVDREKVNALVEKIDIFQPAAVISYGAKPMGEIARFADSLLENVRSKDAGEVGKKLSDLVVFVRENGVLTEEEKASGFLRKLPLIGGLFKKVERISIDRKSLTQQVDTISGHLDRSMTNLVRDINVLEQLYARNLNFYRDITLYVEAGKLKLEQVNNELLPELRMKAEMSKDMMDAQSVKDLVENITRFERRIHDLELSKTVAIQTAPQIRIVQSNNQQLVEKIQSSIMTTLPIWKSQLVLQMSLEAQGKAAKLQKEVSDTTNELLRRNAEILQQNSIATATEVERSIIDVETLRDVQQRLINTVEDTMRIASDAKAKRAQVEVELAGMEENLRQRLSAAITKYQ